MADTLTRAEIALRMHRRIGITRREASLVVDDIIELVRGRLLAGENVKVSGFGSFVVREVGERPGRDPRTHQPIVISRRRVVRFKPSGALKAAVNRGGGR